MGPSQLLYFNFCWELVLHTHVYGTFSDFIQICDSNHTHSLVYKLLNRAPVLTEKWLWYQCLKKPPQHEREEKWPISTTAGLCCHLEGISTFTMMPIYLLFVNLVDMALLCCQSGPEGPRKQLQWRRGNVESTPTERAALLKQQPKQKNTNWVSLEQKIEQAVLLV